ncbi:MAG: PQQ-binding-like beta-propeller repeat protein [Planctomycetota bacterium]
MKTHALLLTISAIGIAGVSLTSPAFAQRNRSAVPASDQKAKITIYLLPNNAQKEFDVALDFLKQGSVADALSRLRPFVTKYANRVIPVRYTPEGTIQAVAESDTWLGVAWFLQKHFLQLPTEIREKVEQIDGPSARARLQTALAGRDVEALLALHRESPWTKAGTDAIHAVAGFMLESGALEESLAVYRRILQSSSGDADSTITAHVAARIAAIELALGATPKIPRELNNEFVDFGGERIQLKSLAQRAPEFVTKTQPPGEFTNNTEHLLPDPGPIADRSPWYKSLSEEPVVSRKNGRPIQPVIVKDTVYISNGWSVSAFDLVSGRPRWEDPGFAEKWELIRSSDRDSYVEGEHRGAMMAPAVAGGIVVTPLIVPLKRNDSFTFQAANAPVIKIIPIRKLHAFDAATGKPVWDHWNPETAKSSQDFIDIYQSAGPPVIAGDRVIAPVYMMPDGATIEYHLAAFHLATGELLWNTNVVTGTLPINMFGRSTNEFYCGPPAVEGDRVFISTDLGALASIEVATGQILWLHRYESLAMPRATYYDAEVQRTMFWAASPPALSKETIIFTPVDSQNLLAIDKESGRRIGQLQYSRIAPDIPKPTGSMRYLLGIIDNNVYVAGQGIVAIEVPTLDSPQFHTRAIWPGELSGGMPTLHRPALTETTILVPFPSANQEKGIVVLDRRDLKQLHTIPYEADETVRSNPGDVAVGDGVVITVNNPHVVGYSNLEILVDLARRAADANPKDASLAERLGRCLRLRGEQRFKNKDYGSALADFAEAERFILKQPNSEQPAAELNLLAGNAHENRGEMQSALDKYRRAFSLAKNVVTRTESGIALERSLGADALQEKLQLLKTLEKDVGVLRGNTKEYGNIPFALYVCLRRAELSNQPEEAVAAWSDAIKNFGTEYLEKPKTEVRSFARARIAGAIAKYGPECYAEIEKQAQARLASLGKPASPDDLSELISTYPNSNVAIEATYRKLEQLVVFGRANEVPSAAAEILATNPSETVKRRVYKAEAAALRSIGNLWLADVLDARAAGKPAPALATVTNHSGAATPLAASASASSFTTRFHELAKPAFDDGSAPNLIFAFEKAKIVALRAAAHAEDGATGDVAWSNTLPRDIYKNDGTLIHDLIQTPLITILNGVVSCVHHDQITGYSAESGNIVYNLVYPRAIEAFTAGGGAILIITNDSERFLQVSAIDAVAGSKLWSNTIERAADSFWCIANDTELLLLPTSGPSPRKMLRYQIATGERIGEVVMEKNLASWIEGLSRSAAESESVQLKNSASGSDSSRQVYEDKHRSFSERFRLYGGNLVFTRPGSNNGLLTSFDLDRDGAAAWSLRIESTERINSVLFARDEIYVFKTFEGKKEERRDGKLLAISPRTGESRVLTDIPNNAIIAGLARFDDYKYWNLPVIVALTGESAKADGTASTRIDVVELPSGRKWSKSIPVHLAASTENVPAPGVGKDLIAIGYSCVVHAKNQSQNELRIFRRDTGEYAIDRAFALHGKPIGIRTTPKSFAIVARASQRDTRLHRYQSSEK